MKVADVKELAVTTATAESKGEIKMGNDLRPPAWHRIGPFCPIKVLLDNLPRLKLYQPAKCLPKQGELRGQVSVSDSQN